MRLFCYRPPPVAQTEGILSLSDPAAYQDLDGRTLSELHGIILALKTKHHREGVSEAEHRRWAIAKHIFRQKLQALPRVQGACENNITING